MKYIITTVGTSAIDKSKISVENFKDKNYDYFDIFKKDLTKKKKELLDYFSKLDIKHEHLKNFPAEIKSLVKLNCDKNTFNYLIISDTAECRLCAEFLKDYLKNKFESESELVKIKGLRIDNLDTFQKEGMVNLVEELDKINSSHYKDKILNITGGYKATIPYLTILGQIWDIPLYYIFEDLDNLIEIPKIPIALDWNLFEKYSKEFVFLESGKVNNWTDFKKKFEYNDLEKIEGIIYEYGNMAELSPLGKILYKKYKSMYLTFCVTEEVKEKIEENEILIDILKKLADTQIRSQHIDSIKDIDIKPFKIFKVTGKGGNIYRIVFKEENNNIFISHIFYGSEVHGSGTDYTQILKVCNWAGINFNQIIKIKK